MRMILVVSAAVLTLAQWLQPPAPRDQPPNQPPVPAGATHKPAVTVQMTNQLQFSPAAVTVNVGQYVLWRNDSREEHTVTDQPGAAIGTEMKLPSGAKPFDSGPVEPGYGYEHRFDTAGTYRYACRFDGAAGMVGMVTVRPPVPAGVEPPRPQPK